MVRWVLTRKSPAEGRPVAARHHPRPRCTPWPEPNASLSHPGQTRGGRSGRWGVSKLPQSRVLGSHLATVQNRRAATHALVFIASPLQNKGLVTRSTWKLLCSCTCHIVSRLHWFKTHSAASSQRTWALLFILDKLIHVYLGKTQNVAKTKLSSGSSFMRNPRCLVDIFLCTRWRLRLGFLQNMSLVHIKPRQWQQSVSNLLHPRSS